MSSIDLDVLSNIPLPSVLLELGAKEAERSKPQYRTRRFDLDDHVYGVTGPLWSDNATGEGGWGAVSLYRHASGCTFVDAVHHLAGIQSTGHFSSYQAFNWRAAGGENGGVAAAPVAMPEPCPAAWRSVRAYLCGRRALSARIVDGLHDADIVYADGHANAVFRCAGMGAMLRGTRGAFTRNVGRALQCGPFVAGPVDARCAAVTEAPIDALSVLSLAVLHGRTPPRVLATGGRFIRAEALASYLTLARRIYAAQDADCDGDRQADALIARYPTAHRLRPTAGKDWNDVLQAERARGGGA